MVIMFIVGIVILVIFSFTDKKPPEIDDLYPVVMAKDFTDDLDLPFSTHGEWETGEDRTEIMEDIDV